MNKPKVGDRYKIEFEIIKTEEDVVECKTKGDYFILLLRELDSAEKIEPIYDDGEWYFAKRYNEKVGIYRRIGGRWGIVVGLGTVWYDNWQFEWIGEKIERLEK